MSKLNIKICDACGGVPAKFAAVSRSGFWPRKYCSYGSGTSADLCQDCASTFRKMMAGDSKAQAKVAAALESCGYVEPKKPAKKTVRKK